MLYYGIFNSNKHEKDAGKDAGKDAKAGSLLNFKFYLF
jgi:hypothetical protein